MDYYDKVEVLGEQETSLWQARDRLYKEAYQLRELFDEIALDLRQERLKKITSLLRVKELEENLLNVYEDIYCKEEEIDSVMDELDVINEESIAILKKIIEDCKNPSNYK